MDRYDRQRRVKQIGPAGQEKIANAHVIVVGLGALGSYAAAQLIRAGVGKLTLVDPDQLAWSNLQRQALYTEADVEQQRLKVTAAKQHLLAINKNAAITALPTPLTEEVVQAGDFNLVLDCLDNFAGRELLNALAIKYHFPYLFASCAGTFGNVMAIKPDGRTPCLRCLYPNLDQLKQTDCDLIGVLTPLVTLVAGWQVALTLKYLTQPDQVDWQRLTTIDAWSMEVHHYQIQTAADCLACQTDQVLFPPTATRQVQSLCGTKTYQYQLQSQPPIDELALWLTDRQIEVQPGLHYLTFQWRGLTMSLFENGRLLLYGSQDLAAASATIRNFLTATQAIIKEDPDAICSVNHQ